MNAKALVSRVFVGVCLVSSFACNSNSSVTKNDVNADRQAVSVNTLNKIESKKLPIAPPKACTLIGCMDTVKITLPQRLHSLAGEYILELTLDARATRKYKVNVIDRRKVSACEHDEIAPLGANGSDAVFLMLNAEYCQHEMVEEAKSINIFSGFSLLNVKPKKSLNIAIINSAGQHELQENIDLAQIAPTINEPNGPGCGSCQSIVIDLNSDNFEIE